MNNADYIVITGNLVRGDNEGGYVISGVRQLSIDGGIPQVVSPGKVVVKLPTTSIAYEGATNIEDQINAIENSIDPSNTAIDVSEYIGELRFNGSKSFTPVNGNIVLVLDVASLLPHDVQSSIHDASRLLTKLTHNGAEFDPVDNIIDLGNVESNGYKPPDTGIPIDDFNIITKTLLQSISKAISGITISGVTDKPNAAGNITIPGKYYQKPSDGIPAKDLVESIRNNLSSASYVQGITIDGTTYPSVDRNINIGSVQPTPPTDYLSSVQGNLNDSNDVDDLTLNIYLKIGGVTLSPTKGELFITQDDLVTAVQFRNKTLRDYVDFICNKLARKINYSGIELNVVDNIADFTNMLTDNGSQLTTLSGNIVDRRDINHPKVNAYLRFDSNTFEPAMGTFTIPDTYFIDNIKYTDGISLVDKVNALSAMDITAIVLNGDTYSRTDSSINLPTITGIVKTVDGLNDDYFDPEIVAKIDTIFDNVQSLQLAGIEYDPDNGVIHLPNIDAVGYHKPEDGILKTSLSPELQTLINTAALQYQKSAKTIRTANGSVSGTSPDLTNVLDYLVTPVGGIPESMLSTAVTALLNTTGYAIGVKVDEVNQYPETNGKAFLGPITGRSGATSMTLADMDLEIRGILGKPYSGIATITINGTPYGITVDASNKPTGIIELPETLNRADGDYETIKVWDDEISLIPAGIVPQAIRNDANMSLYDAVKILQLKLEPFVMTTVPTTTVTLHNVAEYTTSTPTMIEWGDGTSTTYNANSTIPIEISHTYPDEAAWTITYVGYIGRSGVDPNGQQYITDNSGNSIVQEVSGTLSIYRDMSGGSWEYDAADMFYNATTLTQYRANFDMSNIAPDVQTISHVLSRTFYGCTGLTEILFQDMLDLNLAASVGSLIDHCYYQTFKGCTMLELMFGFKFTYNESISPILAASEGTYVETFADCGTGITGNIDGFAVDIINSNDTPSSDRNTFSNKFSDYTSIDSMWQQ